jgi:hypothetical protein
MPITHSSGNQKSIAPDEFRRRLAHIGAGKADCGQYAAGFNAYAVGTIDADDLTKWPLAVTNPTQFWAMHGYDWAAFLTKNIPADAQGIAYNDPFQPVGSWSWHYGRIERNPASGQFSGITMTDANRSNDLAMGGAFITFDANMAPVAQAGVQPIRELATVADFVSYCNQYYNPQGLYFFVYFAEA